VDGCVDGIPLVLAPPSTFRLRRLLDAKIEFAQPHVNSMLMKFVFHIPVHRTQYYNEPPQLRMEMMMTAESKAATWSGLR